MSGEVNDGHRKLHPECPFNEREVKALVSIASREVILFPKWIIGLLLAIFVAAFAGSYGLAAHNNYLIRDINKSMVAHEKTETLEETTIKLQLNTLQLQVQSLIKNQTSIEEKLDKVLEQKGRM